jgi:hypothetical protein
MTYIYSDVDVGIQGAYIAPRLFDGAIKDAKVVYTDDAKIAEAYKDIEVKPIGGVDAKILKLIENIDTQKEKGLKILAKHFGIEFVSIEETLPLIKEEIEKGK